MTRTILHVDMDAFFASVELRRHPELVGKPVVVGGTGRRGVVAAASYEARAYGVHSAQPSVTARRLCPHAVFLQGDHAHYAAVSARIQATFSDFTPLVEPLSLDEAFLDVTGARRLHGGGVQIAEAIRARIRDEEGLDCAVGVAPSKFLAKLASKAAKPRAGAPGQGPRPGPGVLEVPVGGELAFLHPLPVNALWGVGPATLKRLEVFGLRTVGDLASVPERSLVARLGGAAGRHLHQLANGRDDRPVVVNAPPKSVSNEETFPSDLRKRDELDRAISRLSDATASRLRAGGLAGRTVTLKVRFGDFRTVTRSATLADAVDTAHRIGGVARELLRGLDTDGGVRLLGVAVTKLDAAGPRQLTLDDSDEQAWAHAEAAIDRIRDRYGRSAIASASQVAEGRLNVRRGGDQQWGPAPLE